MFENYADITYTLASDPDGDGCVSLSAFSLCYRCGSLVLYKEAHDDWHYRVITR